MEKYVFAMSNRNKFVKSACQVVEVYKARRFQSTKENAFHLPQRKIPCALIIMFPGSAEVAAGLSNPPTLGVRRVGAFGTGSNAGLGLGKLYGGRGLGAQVATTCPFWCPESVVL